MTLWDYPPAVASSPTSQAAASAIAGSASVLRERVYDAIAAAGSTGATDEELQTKLAMEGSTERPRRVELLRAGRVRDAGLTRRTKSGRMAVCWVATENGE